MAEHRPKSPDIRPLSQREREAYPEIIYRYNPRSGIDQKSLLAGVAALRKGKEGFPLLVDVVTEPGDLSGNQTVIVRSGEETRKIRTFHTALVVGLIGATQQEVDKLPAEERTQEAANTTADKLLSDFKDFDGTRDVYYALSVFFDKQGVGFCRDNLMAHLVDSIDLSDDKQRLGLLSTREPYGFPEVTLSQYPILEAFAVAQMQQHVTGEVVHDRNTFDMFRMLATYSDSPAAHSALVEAVALPSRNPVFHQSLYADLYFKGNMLSEIVDAYKKAGISNADRTLLMQDLLAIFYAYTNPSSHMVQAIQTETAYERQETGRSGIPHEVDRIIATIVNIDSPDPELAQAIDAYTAKSGTATARR